MSDELIDKISSIGSKMVKCRKNCMGIVNDPENGIIPRCLFIEEGRKSNAKGCVIVGINPGYSKKSKKEPQYYLKNGISYHITEQYWKNEVKDKHSYYVKLRNFIHCVGYTGRILWTELVKCESDDSTDPVPLQTFRVCSSTFLTKELELIPDNWPIIGVGREAYKALSYLYPKRSVLGVPHPTSSRGHFSYVFANKNKFVNNIQLEIEDFKKSKNAIALWLKANK